MKLLPCPFCGSTNTARISYGSSLSLRVECQDCGGAGPEVELTDTSDEAEEQQDQAVALGWNRRT